MKVGTILTVALLATGATQAQTSWTYIAGEGAAFAVVGTQTVRYGVGSTWLQRSVTTTGQCSNAFFGSDPAVGVVKHCQQLGPAQPLPAAPSAPAPVTTLEYDANGNPTRTIQAPGLPGFDFSTSAAYDKLDRLTTHTDARAKSTLFAYNGRADLTQVTDPRNLVTQYPRNGLGDPTQLISPDTGTAAYTRDAAGNITSRADPRGVTVQKVYDALNRVTLVRWRKTGSPDVTYGYSYDLVSATYPNGVGRLGFVGYPAGSGNYGYDAQGRITVDVARLFVLSGVNAELRMETNYSYDAAGNVTAIRYPSGRKLVIGYTDGQPSTIGLAKDVSSAAAPLLSQIQWQPFGPVKSWLWQMTGGTLAHERVHDTSGRPVRYRLGSQVRDIRYDDADRITGYTHYDAVSGNAQPNLDQTFGYDALGRLKNIGTASSSWAIGYDDNGNRTGVTLNGVTSSYTTPATSNKLAGLSNPTRNLSYDEIGNITADSNPVGAYTAAYALDGRLATVTKGGVTTSYAYNAYGQRVRKSNGGGNTTTVMFVYDLQGHLLGEYDGTGKALREYVWLGDEPVAVFVPDAVAANPPLVYYIHSDHLGAPRFVIDRSNRERWHWLAEPFGITAAHNNPAGLGTFTFNLRFPGQYFDQESGLHYNYFRDYDPSTGRYVQSDPIGLAGGINTFAYSFNSPTDTTDPEGLNSAMALYRAGATGYRIGEAINPHVQPMLARAIDALFLPDPMARDLDHTSDAGPLNKDKALEKDLDHELYKWRCDDDKPPAGLDKCETAKWQRDRAKQCQAQRQRWDDKWWKGRHVEEIRNVGNRIAKWERTVAKECKCP